jgi:hypothetical protein
MGRIKLNQLEGYFLRRKQSTADITVPNGQNFVILSSIKNETPPDLVAISNDQVEGAVTINVLIGTVSLISIPTINKLSPKNLLQIRDATTLNYILSNNHQVYGLLQVDLGAISGNVFNDTDVRAQISFIRQNSLGTDYEIVPVSDIQNKVINYTYTLRFDIGNHLDIALLEPIFQEPFFQENINSPGGGITESEHETLRQLIHFLSEGPGDGFASGAYKEILPSGNPFPTSIIWYTDSTKTQKIVEKTIVRTGINPTTITWLVYNTDGITVAHTVSDNISYVNNVFEASRIRTII